MLGYVINNFIKDCTLTSYSQHTLYLRTNLYSVRPSEVYRTTGTPAVGAPGTPEWICVDLAELKHVTFCGLFNHNFTDLTGTNDILNLYGCTTDCTHDCSAALDLKTMPTDYCGDACDGLSQPIPDFLNLWHAVSYLPAYQYWRLEMIDESNPDEYLEIGEWVLAELLYFHRGALTNGPNWVRVQPGRADGPMFFMGNQRTHYGQDWTNYYSDAEHFTLTFKNINNACIVDEIQAFLRTVQQNGGQFVLVPDDTKPFCYYVMIENLSNYADRLMYGCSKELREWHIELKTLTQGIALI